MEPDDQADIRMCLHKTVDNCPPTVTLKVIRKPPTTQAPVTESTTPSDLLSSDSGQPSRSDRGISRAPRVFSEPHLG